MVARGGVVCVLVILMFAKGYRSVILDTLYLNNPCNTASNRCNTRGQYNISTYGIFKFQCYIVRVELENPHKASSIDILLIFCIWIFTICTKNYI
jgi:hypothetical protein